VGFSTFKGGKMGGPDNTPEAAQDFNRLLKTLFEDILPEFAHNDLHMAGESFAGKYVPSFSKYITERQQLEAPDVVSVPIRSILLFDAAVDMASSSVLGYYDHLCRVDESGRRIEGDGGFNATACSALEEAAPECERLIDLCRESYDRHVCEASSSFCQKHLGKWLHGDVYEGGRDPYDDRKKCGSNPPLCEGFDGPGSYGSYLNSTHVKEALGFGEGDEFVAINFDTNDRWSMSMDAVIPTTRELTYLLDETPIRVMVLNGNNDIIV